MMPEPGRQKPTPYLEPAVARKSYTSLLVLTAWLRSASPPNLFSLREQQGHTVRYGAHDRPHSAANRCTMQYLFPL